ncbi:hypothetical protein ACFQZ4_48975 [Catellatospora coxensis]
MRRRLALLVAAAMALVLTAFLLPLALLIQTVAAERAVGAATTEAQALVPVIAAGDHRALELAVQEATGRSGQPFTVYLPDGVCSARPRHAPTAYAWPRWATASPSPATTAARSSSRWDWHRAPPSSAPWSRRPNCATAYPRRG